LAVEADWRGTEELFLRLSGRTHNVGKACCGVLCLTVEVLSRTLNLPRLPFRLGVHVPAIRPRLIVRRIAPMTPCLNE
jgi:hypothetical protein